MQPFALANIHQRFLQVLQIVFGKVVLVSSLAVDWPFGVGLRLYIEFAQAVDYDVGMDDGYTGTNFNRPSFQKMIVDLKQGDIKVIMVKDLSRLGRDYIGVGDYIEQIFPLMGVRFIAVNNSFDSMKLNNGTPGIEVAVSNLVNNMYSRDIAKKIRAALETNWKNGKATCTNVPFGYVWNKKGGRRWEIDPEAAACVKKVFELALSGRNTTQIAYGMNELNLR